MNGNVQYINSTYREFAPAKRGDVGHDLFVNIYGYEPSLLDRVISNIINERVLVILPFQARLVPSGIKLSMPDSIWCMVTARSSAMKKKLMVIGGIIDSGYQGELFSVLHNFSLRPRIIRHAERYSQVIFFPAVRPALEEAHLWFDRETERGETGFGSSGQ